MVKPPTSEARITSLGGRMKSRKARYTITINGTTYSKYNCISIERFSFYVKKPLDAHKHSNEKGLFS
jgi:hypothetical protein